MNWRGKIERLNHYSGRTVGSGILKGIIYQKQIYKGRENNEMSIL